jgi:tetratricopeptide (TPR) repeat protein
MTMKLTLKTRCTVAAVSLAAACSAQQDDNTHPAGDPDKLGQVNFATSCSSSAQPGFERAVAMLHSFWFSAADSAFTSLIAEDPGCAMAHWGIAMTHMGNPMTRAAPSATALAEGLAAVERAKELSASASHREQMYIDAAMAFYRDHEKRDHPAGMRELEVSFAALHGTHPEDDEATIFLARTMVANAPPGDQSFSKQLAAAALLEPLFEKHPDHPGLAHYLIHAYDAPATAQRASKAAQVYADIAPAAPHALHMPTHIFTRLGYWNESIELNARSAQAEPVPDAAVHPMDYMVYAHLQLGQDSAAKVVVDRAVDISDRYYGGLIGYNFAAMPARFALEREDWTAASQLKLPVGALPYVEAVTRFARALGSARSGKTDAAATEVAELARLKSQLDAARDAYWATIVESQRLAAQAWLQFAQGSKDEAVKTAAAAAQLEETVEKHPVTPGPLLPARELEGDMLMEVARPADALQAYEKTLAREPRRARALFGAARAAELSGNSTTAKARYQELKDLMSAADAGRRERLAATRYLGG